VNSFSAFTILLIAAAVVGAAGAFSNRGRRDDPGFFSRVPIDAAWTVVLAVVGVLYADSLHTQFNPAWYPVGQDWREFLVLGLDIQSGGAYHPVPQRYPFYPWVAVQLANASGLPVHIGLMQVNIIAGGLLPAAVYRLGVAIGPRSLALAGAWLALHVPTVATVIGPPTDYLFHGLIHVVAVSTGIRAFRQVGIWRWFCFGVALALLMAANMKSLVFLLIAAPLAVVALSWNIRSNSKIVLISLFSWLLPMVLCWQVYAGITRWVQEAYTLDYNVYRTQVVVARAHGRTAPLPTDLGWHPSDEKQRGYWGVGRKGAWKNLDKTLTFLARGPKYNLPTQVRLDGATEGLTKALHLPSPTWLLLGVLGCLAPLRRRKGDNHLGSILAAAWLTGITLAHFFGLMATHFIPRYALVLLIPAPVMLLAGIGLLVGRSRWQWLIPAVALGMSQWADSPPSRDHLQNSPEVVESALNPHPDFWAVRDSLTENDIVIDLTGNRILRDLWGTKPALFQAIRDEETQVVLRPHTKGRRVLVMPGALNMGDRVRQWTGAKSGRLQELRPFVVEDTSPKEALKLTLVGLGL
jgi:hypothetical protein